MKSLPRTWFMSPTARAKKQENGASRVYSSCFFTRESPPGAEMKNGVLTMDGEPIHAVNFDSFGDGRYLDKLMWNNFKVKLDKLKNRSETPGRKPEERQTQSRQMIFVVLRLPKILFERTFLGVNRCPVAVV